MEWLPTPLITFVVDTRDRLGGFTGQNANLMAGGRSFRAMVLGESTSYPLGLRRFRGLVCEETDQGARSVSSVIAHLCNFSEYIGGAVATGHGGWIAGRMTLCDSDWRVDIDAVENCRSLTEAARVSGGFALTHVCRVSRGDGSTFLPPGPLEQLLRFLSFAKGSWAGLFLPAGYDDAGSQVWDEWSCQKIGPYARFSNWFPEQQPEAFASTFGRFNNLWDGPQGRRMLTLGIAWYIHAVSMGELEARLVQAVAGLELLTYFGLVHWDEGPRISDAAYDQHVAGGAHKDLAAKIRGLLAVCQIRSEIPDGLRHCRDLVAGPHGRKHGDGPEVAAWVRNSVTHPIPRLPLTSEVVWEALQLALQYMELAILRFLDYHGPYCDRLGSFGRTTWVGEYEPVPWTV